MPDILTDDHANGFECYGVLYLDFVLQKARSGNVSRIAEIKQGEINQFTLDELVRLALRAGLHPRIELKAA